MRKYLTGGKAQAEAAEVARARRVDPVPVRRPHVLRILVPGAATKHPFTPTARPFRIVSRAAFVIALIVPIRTPLENISCHVV